MRLTERVREFIPKACRKERFVILRDEEIGGLDMATTDEDLVLRGVCRLLQKMLFSE